MMKKQGDKIFLTPKPGKSILNFGKVVAEDDPELQEYYVDADRYVNRAMSFDDPAIFFVGPKGAGKSAILQMVRLNRALDAGRVINISPDDLAFSALANVSASTPILTEAGRHQWLFKSLWDYVLAIEVLKREYKDRENLSSTLYEMVRSYFGHQHDSEARQLLKISLGDEGRRESFSTKILQLVNEVELSAEVPEKAKVSGKAKIDGSKAGQGGQLGLLALVNTVAKKIAETVRVPYHILIDDLDLHWSDTPVQNAFIAALFTSLRNFSKPPNMKCVVAIRDQIFRRLPLADRDKYYDWVCHVDWEAPNVRKMVERRITSRIDIVSKDIWGGLFPENAFNRMIHHSYGRPREAIKLVSMCVLEADRKHHIKVEVEDLTVGISKFSDARVTEIAAEFSHKHPGLDQLIRKMHGWQKEFAVGELVRLAEDVWLEVECGEEIAREYQWAGEYKDEPKGLARILLECGILLYKSNQRAEPILYDMDKRPEVTGETWVGIHPAFWPALGIA